jgi:hypothetical protein
MPRNQRNFGLQDYVSDDGNTYSVRGETGGAFSGVDGHAATYAFPAYGRKTLHRSPRSVTAQDSVTFRTVTGIIYTPTAFAAISLGDTIAVTVPGLATTVNYTVSGFNAEKRPRVHAPRPLADS